MILKKYINNVSGIQAFQLMRFGTLLLISVVFAKTGFPNETIGSYEIFLFIATLLSSFWINGLIQSFLPLFKSNSSFSKKESLKSPEIFNAFILISIFSITAVLILMIFRQPIEKAFTQTNEIPYFNLLILHLFLSCPAYLIEYIYLLKNKPEWIIRYGVSVFALQLLVVTTPALLGFDMKICISAFVAISGIRYIWLLFLIKKYSLLQISGSFLAEHLKLGYPLIISALFGSSAQYVDNFLVLNKFDPATFAIFRYGAKEFPLVLLMANALSTALIAEFSDKSSLKESLQILRQKSKKLMHLLFPITLVFLIFSNWLYPRIFNENFTESAKIFNIYLLLIISRLVFPHTIIIGLKKTKVVMFASLAELVVNISLSLIFIKFWGIEGIAFATIIAYAIQKIIWITYNKLKLNLSPNKYIPLSTLGIYSILSIIIFYFVY